MKLPSKGPNWAAVIPSTPIGRKYENSVGPEGEMDTDALGEAVAVFGDVDGDGVGGMEGDTLIDGVGLIESDGAGEADVTVSVVFCTGTLYPTRLERPEPTWVLNDVGNRVSANWFRRPGYVLGTVKVTTTWTSVPTCCTPEREMVLAVTTGMFTAFTTAVTN